MQRKCSHMWKWYILCPFHLLLSKFQADQTGNRTKKKYQEICKNHFATLAHSWGKETGLFRQ